MMPTCSDLRRATTSNRRSTSRSLKDAVGSSMMSTLASEPIALAISTSCCSGMLRVSTSRSASMSAPTRVSRSRASRRRAAPVDAAPRRARLERERDVLGDRQVREQRRLLINGRDAQRARRCRAHRGHRLRRQQTGPRVGGHGARHHLDQRRLARAVLADERVDFSCVEIERHAGQRAHACVRLGDDARVEKRRTGHR